MTDLPTPRTFEWVLWRVRHGASWETFRRSDWAEGVHLAVWNGRLMVEYPSGGMDALGGFSILEGDWEEIA